jgi:ATP/maltotriose-dependent transcriptional regulator MalT
LLSAIERHLATSDRSTSDQDNRQFRLLHTLVEIAWSHCYYRLGQAQSSVERARSAMDWLPPDIEQVEIYALMYLALSSQLNGREDMAVMELEKGLRKYNAHLTSIAHLLMVQALVYLASGKMHQVEQTARYLLQTARDSGMDVSQNYAHWLLGIVYYEWNLLDEALYHFTFVVTNQHLVNFWVGQDAMYGLALAYHAQGLDKKANEAAEALLTYVQEQHNIDELKVAYAFHAHLALLQDEIEKASQWIELAGEHELLGPMRFLEDPPVTQAYFLLACGDEAHVARGQTLLNDLKCHAEAIHSTRKTIQVYILQAWAYQQQGRQTEALDMLERALALGHPGRLIRIFADLPPLARVIQKLRKHRKAHQFVDPKFDAYLQSIIAAMIPSAPLSASKGELMLQEGLEPLTKRELFILRLLDKGYTNKEIARELVVTTGTVKVHTKNIYRKLNVNNRQAAVALSKPLGLLATDQG